MKNKKICGSCGRERPFSKFYGASDEYGVGLQSYCKDCLREYNRKNRHNWPSYKKAQNKGYYTNREKERLNNEESRKWRVVFQYIYWLWYYSKEQGNKIPNNTEFFTRRTTLKKFKRLFPVETVNRLYGELKKIIDSQEVLSESMFVL